MEFLPSSRGSMQLVIDGYIYHKTCAGLRGIYWRCCNRKCKGRVKTVGDKYFINHTHDHSPDPLKVEECKTKSRLKGLVAANPTVPPSTMARFVLAEKPDEIANLLPNPTVYSQMIRRMKQRLEEKVTKDGLPMPFVLVYFPCDRTFSIRSIAVLRPDVDVSKQWTIDELLAQGPFEICRMFEGNKQLLPVDVCAVSTDKAYLRAQMKEFSENVASVTPILDPIVDVNSPVDNALKGCKKVFFLSGNKPRNFGQATPVETMPKISIPSFKPTVSIAPAPPTEVVTFKQEVSVPSFKPTVPVAQLNNTDRLYNDLLQKYNDLLEKYEDLRQHHSQCEGFY